MTEGLVRVAARRANVGFLGGFRLALMLLGALLLASGVRAAGAGYWHTSGNQILDANNQPVRIAAVNWYGFETTTFVAHGLWASDYKNILNLIKSSGFNTVRIPLSDQVVAQNPVPPATAINRNGMNTDWPANATALQILDRIIAHCSTIGLRVILDNHRSNAGDSAQEEGLWYTSAWPESTWLANWRALTTRYLGNTTVIGMDIRNEPHGPVCWGGDPAGCSAANDWHAAAQRAGNAILAINSNLLIFVEGNDRYNNSFTWWGGMLRGVASRPVVLSVPNRVVYSAHDYGPHLANQPWFNGSATPASLAAVWDQNFGFIHNQNIAPLWIGEFGTTNNSSEIQNTAAGSQGQWFSSLVQYLSGKPAMSWAYWAMNGNDSYALFNMNFNAVVSQQKLSLLQSIQFPLDQQPGNVPAITSVTPTTVLPGAAVTINGSNFGTTQGTSTVRFGAITVTSTTWSASQIAVTAPLNLPPGAYAVTVTVNGVSSNAATINVPVVDPFPQISSLSPNSGGAGQLVNVNGVGFGTTQGTSTVRIGTTVATVQLWANSNVLVAVPNLTPGTYPVTVTVGGRVSNSMNFLVTVHRLNSITPNTGNPGASVTLAGTGFGATQGASSVQFGTTNVSITSWSNTQIVATVPNLTGGTAVGVTVTVNGVPSNPVNFLVTSPVPPAISALSPTSGAVGSNVTITGSNFGVFQGQSTVRFGTTNANIVSWGNTQLTVTVPGVAAGAVPVTVTVNGNVSNSASFTVTTVTQPNYTFACPASLTVNRGANGSVTCTLTRTGGFTGSVAFSVSGLPAGVTASASPASTTGNSTAVTFTASAAATLGTGNVTVSAAATGFTTRTATVALTVASGPTGGVVTATGAVASNSPWFAEEQVRLNNTAPLTALTVTITVARNPASLASGGQYNTIGSNLIAQSVSTTSTQVVYTFTLVAGQTLPAGTGRTFAAQMSPGGSAHPTSGDSWSVSYTSGGSSNTASGTF